MAQEFDVVIIGGGPGGYVAAIKAAQLGLRTACIEKSGKLGGTCLNVGCIPSKALLYSSHKYHEIKHNMEQHGIEVGNVGFNLKRMMERKSKVVTDLVRGIEGLFAKNKVTYFKGVGSFISANEIKIQGEKQEERINTKNVIIATGSDIIRIPGIEIDEKNILSSTGALELDKVPSKMIVIGGGYIGLEMGSVWSRLGSDVTIIEYADRILAAMDSDISKEHRKILEKQGLKFKLTTKVVSAKNAGKNDVEVILEPSTGGVQEKLKVDALLVAVGRKPYTEGLGLEGIGLKTDERGKLAVNEKYETSVKGVYAIGDIIAGPMLAHKAEEEGVAAVEIIAGQHGHVNYEAIPGVVYTFPEVASVGKTEDELKKMGVEYNVGKFPFLANSRARANGETDGFVKIIADKKTDRILGAHIIGANAGELIQEIVIGMEFKAAAEDLARTSHGHPGFSEALKEAALAAFFKAIHI